MDDSEFRVRTGQGPQPLAFEDFKRRFVMHFYDPKFGPQQGEIDALAQTAWTDYCQSRKSPITRRAGPGYFDPQYDLSVEWLATHEALLDAQRQHDDSSRPRRILLICASPRNDKTCPGEMSKSFRLTQLAKDELQRHQIEIDMLDLSLLTSEYGRVIYPCKGCVSTAMPLCHWPCSCYPNHSLGQTNDWMNEIYPRWVAAHGIMIITPVHWYQAPSVLKLMIDRLVCADGGNADPTSTHGKRAAEAKQLELQGWSYPRHLAGRHFAVVVHGDAGGTEALRRSLTDWLQDMHLLPAAAPASIDRLLGYYEPYASSHEALDADQAVQEEVRIAARALGIQLLSRGSDAQGQLDVLPEPRPK
jgi:multimeric flavodoxin WrbA